MKSPENVQAGSEVLGDYPAEGYRREIKDPEKEKVILQALLAELSRGV